MNYEELAAPVKVVVDMDDVDILGVTSERLMNDMTEEQAIIEAFYIAYEGNVFGKKGFVQADWDTLIQTQTS